MRCCHLYSGQPFKIQPHHCRRTYHHGHRYHHHHSHHHIIIVIITIVIIRCTGSTSIQLPTSQNATSSIPPAWQCTLQSLLIVFADCIIMGHFLLLMPSLTVIHFAILSTKCPSLFFAGGDNNATNTGAKILGRRETVVGKIKADGFGNITISPSSLHRPVLGRFPDFRRSHFGLVEIYRTQSGDYQLRAKLHNSQSSHIKCVSSSLAMRKGFFSIQQIFERGGSL